jgi:hypothetical protein
VDFKLENVLVSLHSLKTMGLGPFGLKNDKTIVVYFVEYTVEKFEKFFII